ncbi:hypothetical protein DL89DRAFT_268186, partial [Linderina pennispora]
ITIMRLSRLGRAKTSNQQVEAVNKKESRDRPPLYECESLRECPLLIPVFFLSSRRRISTGSRLVLWSLSASGTDRIEKSCGGPGPFAIKMFAIPARRLGNPRLATRCSLLVPTFCQIFCLAIFRLSFNVFAVG